VETLLGVMGWRPFLGLWGGDPTTTPLGYNIFIKINDD